MQHNNEIVPEIWAEPLVVNTLLSSKTYLEVYNNLPEVEIINPKYAGGNLMYEHDF